MPPQTTFMAVKDTVLGAFSIATALVSIGVAIISDLLTLAGTAINSLTALTIQVRRAVDDVDASGNLLPLLVFYLVLLVCFPCLVVLGAVILVVITMITGDVVLSADHDGFYDASDYLPGENELLPAIWRFGATRPKLLGNKCSGCLLLLVVYMILTACSCFVSWQQLGDACFTDGSCRSGLSCHYWDGCKGKTCVQTAVTNPFGTVDTSLPFNKYAFLTTHNSFSIAEGVPRTTWYNQEDSVTDQLKNGVRALMLDVYDYLDDIWLCHSAGGQCYAFTAFGPAMDTLREIEAFLLTNPSEIVTLILEDHVTSHHGLSSLFNKTGLMKYWFPVSWMPRNGEDWPRVRDMIQRNHRLLVFSSVRLKESTEGIAYQWNYMVENQHGDGGMGSDLCYNRSESPVLFDRSKSLVLVNYFRTIPLEEKACMEHSKGLMATLRTCHAAAGNRWANFLAVDYYKRSDGGGVFAATEMLNGKLICGRDDVRACRKLNLKKALYDVVWKMWVCSRDRRLAAKFDLVASKAHSLFLGAKAFGVQLLADGLTGGP